MVKQESKAVIIRMTPAFHRALKVSAAREGKTIQELCMEALKAGTARKRREAKCQKV